MEVVKIEKSKLVPLTDNLRKMTDEDMMLLEKSISDLGVVEPLHVVEYEGGKYYLIVNGNHRFQVLTQKFEMNELPCVIIGKDFPMDRVYVEAVRLNSISGEFDMVALVEKVGKIVKRWSNEGWSKRNIASALGLRESSSIMKLLLSDSKKAEENKSREMKASELEKMLNKFSIHPITFFGNICVIKDNECVSIIRDIMLASEVEDGQDGLEKLREILRKGHKEFERRS